MLPSFTGGEDIGFEMKRSSETALKVAEFLQKQPQIEKVLYPGLPSHKGHEIAKKQTRSGYGAALSFVVKKTENLKKFVDTLRENAPIIYGESLASPETILAYPPLMSHKSLPKEIRESLGITDGFFRLSVGFEDAEDIVRGIEVALKTL
jgi:cystathionine beta-lyase/cystathionine gamma-synthase